MKEAVIVAARRTPQGRFMGALARRSAVELAQVAADASLAAADGGRIDLVIVGNVLSAGLGMNVARQVGILAGVPVTAPAFTVNMMCGSGLKAIMLAADAVRSGTAKVVLCGGTESMSNAAYVMARPRTQATLGDRSLVDTLLQDGLIDAFDREHMGLTAERLAAERGIGRAAQDEFAIESQRRYAAAAATATFAAELVPMDSLTADEHPRPDASAADLARLRPAFAEGGTVTAGNASGINDGAAMLVVAAADEARRLGWPVLAVIDGQAEIGCEPRHMGLGPVHAVRRLLAHTNRLVADFDHCELNEAFAAQALACITELGLDPTRVNPCGGGIALGHPLGATGARLVTHLAHRIGAGAVRRGLVTLCVGGGMGLAMSLSVP